MVKPLFVPGVRDVRGSIDQADRSTDGDSEKRLTAAVVACPPNPNYGGSRSDPRIQSVSNYLTGCGIDCLRFDYGEWDGGNGEQKDTRSVINWANDRYERVGVFGYSFGGTIALLSAAGISRQLAGVSVLAPESSISEHYNSAEVLESIDVPTQIIYGSCDSTVDWENVVYKARNLGYDVVELQSDHFFVGQHEQVAVTSSEFLLDKLKL